MEHGIILLIEAILALDRKLQKTLQRVVPELPRLRAEPRDILADEPIVIGPRRPYAVATVLGLVVAIVVMAVFALAALERPANRPAGPIYLVTAIVAIVVSGAATAALVLHWFRGGSAVLRPEGAEFVYRGRRLFCPWTLFQAPGALYQPDHKRVILPVNDSVVLVLRTSEEVYVARPASETKSTPLSACADGQVALLDLYEVKLAELGQLLLDLGARLGDGIGPATHTVALPAGPLATAESGDWLLIRLTRLPFPPICCRCGNATREAIPFPLDPRNTARIELPLCMACQVERTSRRRRALLWGVAFGVGPALLWTLAAGPIMKMGQLCLGIGIFLPVGGVIGLIVGIVLRDRAEPVQFRDYSKSSGTVLMRLKPAAGTSVFRSALGVCDQAEEPEPVGST